MICTGFYSFGNPGSRRGTSTAGQCSGQGKGALRCHHEQGHKGNHCPCYFHPDAPPVDPVDRADATNAKISAKLEEITQRVLKRTLTADGKVTISTFSLRLAMREALDAGREMGTQRLAEILAGDL